MTPISGTSSAALAILQRISSPNAPQEADGVTSLTLFAAPLEPVSKASKQAAATVVAILNEKGGTIDLSGYQNTNAVVLAGDNATIITGDGDDSVEAGSYAKIHTGGGNDGINTHSYADIEAGAGDDVISTYDHATIKAGDGNDHIYANDDATVDGGAGDDWIEGNHYSTVDGGAGNDEIRTYDYSTVDAGDGDDFVVTLGNSTITGGSGNDTLIVTKWRSEETSTFDNSSVDGGDGDDYIQVNANSTVSGGTGNDTIRLLGDGNTVAFNRGDGQDDVWIGQPGRAARTTFNIGGYSADDVTVTRGKTDVTLTFKGSDDKLTLQFVSDSAHFAFEDGSSLDVVPNTYTRLQEIDASADALFGQARSILHF